VSILSNLRTKLFAGAKLVAQPNLGRKDQTQLFEKTKDPKTLRLKRFPKPTWPFAQKPGDKPMQAFRTLTKYQFESLRKYARNHHSTINNVLLTALYRTFFVLNNSPFGTPMLIQVSIDLLKYLPNHKAEAICNLSGALYITLEKKPAEAFDETLVRVAGAMNKIKENYPSLKSAAGFEYLYSLGFTNLKKYLAESAALGKKRNVTFLLLSNFGCLDEYRFANLQVTKGFITSPVMFQPGFMLGATTFNDELTFSVVYCGEENTQRVNSFLDICVAELPK
jgi:NRPS condensation-like uncharacterized protein